MEKIYGVRESGKYGTLKQKYNELYSIYSIDNYEGKTKSKIVITEDSSSEYQLFNNICKKKNIKCDSMRDWPNGFCFFKYIRTRKH